MKTITTIAELTEAITTLKSTGKTIGFVPTMGALHQGHLSLIERCKNENDCCVVSIFVNPTQFNDRNDLLNYPRNFDKDAQLINAFCDIIFYPTAEEMYKKEETEIPFDFDFKGLDKVMEGKFRPNHFNGVVQIVSKLFKIVQADKAYFGEKDFQQVAIIKHMVQLLRIPVEVIACPIVREESGLALSSRNELLSVQERKIAANISRVLFESLNFVPQKSIVDLQSFVIEQINSISGLKVEYFEIVDGNNLQPITHWTNANNIVGCITVFCGKVRLIDNIRYK
ncbi:MAG: pantoate--beta-alanine ligase [Paludibacteraceae bacterium]|nr:pantoate--beta-alanine ligase [Paludibacteraceae bacterium]MBN2788246.1 pantoate--beta-alanine ligase [Paludibacteraceae bacterium]